MARSKMKTTFPPPPPSKRKIPAKEAPDLPPPSVDYDPSTGRAILACLFPRWPSLEPRHRRAFQALGNDLERSKLGTRTKGLGVLQDGITWATQMDEALCQYGTGALKFYSSARYVYFLETLTALADQLAAARAQNKNVGAARGTAASRRESALAARAALLSPLRTFAGGRAPEGAALDAAIGVIYPDDRLGESLADLAALARKWLVLTDEDSVVLLAEARLTADLATAAITAAKELTGSAADAKLEGYIAGNDPPLVNLAEGGVLFEMKEAMRLFGEAHDKYPAVKKLSPGPATRGVLMRHEAKKPEAPPPKPVTP